MALKMNEYVWVLGDTGCGYQPLSYFGYQFAYELANVRRRKGYLHWVQIFDDAAGVMTLDLFYPRSAEIGEDITILVYLCDEPLEEIDWVHGEPGLFGSEIMWILCEIAEAEHYPLFPENEKMKQLINKQPG